MLDLGQEESTLSDLEIEAIDYFVSFVQVLGLPRSIGQIYGVLFTSEVPMAMDEVVSKLGISKGSASQGLNLLKDLGAVLPVQIENDRREHFEADLQVSRIVKHVISKKLKPRLENGERRLEIMARLAEKENKQTQQGRIQALAKWQKRASKVMPLVEKMIR